jgi:hypothetical protein
LANARLEMGVSPDFTTLKACAIRPIRVLFLYHPEYPPRVSLSQALRRLRLGPWLLGASYPLGHALVTCSVIAESRQRVIPFPRSMGCDRRLLLYAGIHLSGCYGPLDNVARIQSLLGLPVNQRGQVVLDDASTIASLVVSHRHLLDGIATSGS